jgi:hypothetical protein
MLKTCERVSINQVNFIIMKKTILIVAVFVMAIGSAFTTQKAFTNPIGWARVAGIDRSGPTDSPNCAANGGATNCYIVVNSTHVTPVYNSEANIGVAAFILKRP